MSTLSFCEVARFSLTWTIDLDTLQTWLDCLRACGLWSSTGDFLLTAARGSRRCCCWCCFIGLLRTTTGLAGRFLGRSRWSYACHDAAGPDRARESLVELWIAVCCKMKSELRRRMWMEGLLLSFTTSESWSLAKAQKA